MRSVPGELMSRTRFRTVSRVFYFERFFFGRLFRLVLAKSLSCFSLIDLAICLEAPLSDDFDFSPRLAANAAPAAICCFLDFAGILLVRSRETWRAARPWGICLGTTLVALRGSSMEARQPVLLETRDKGNHGELEVAASSQKQSTMRYYIFQQTAPTVVLAIIKRPAQIKKKQKKN